MNKVSKIAVSAAFVLAGTTTAYAGSGISSGSAKVWQTLCTSPEHECLLRTVAAPLMVRGMNKDA